MSKDKKRSKKWDFFFKLCASILGPILIPVILAIVSFHITEKIEKSKDLDLFFEYSSQLEKSYRFVKNFFEEIEAGLTDNDPKNFRDKITCLDYNMVNFYFKTMMLNSPDKCNFKNSINLLTSLYWGKNNTVESQYSFREFIIISEVLARKKRPKFIQAIGEIKEILQYFDNVMHLTILSTSLSVHRQDKKIKKRFMMLNDNIDILKNKVFSQRNQKIKQLKTFIHKIKQW